jgi:hypothetical protein
MIHPKIALFTITLNWHRSHMRRGPVRSQIVTLRLYTSHNRNRRYMCRTTRRRPVCVSASAWRDTESDESDSMVNTGYVSEKVHRNSHMSPDGKHNTFILFNQ